MQKSFRAATCIMAGAVFITGGTFANAAAPSAADAHFNKFQAVQSMGMPETIQQKVSAATEITPEKVEKAKDIEETAKKEKQLGVDIETTGVAKADDYVNIRKSADENSEAVGKLYNKAIATVTGEKDGWYQIKSGSVKGYVKADYLTVGDADTIEAAGKQVAKVNADALKIREEASQDAAVVDLAAKGDKLTVDGKAADGWVGVSVGGEEGYVSSDYVEISMSYKKAVSKEEEAAKAEKKQESKGSAVASYAGQFIGNPYVWGGTSLTNGADCSGFVMSVYAHFGVSLPHSSSALRGVGRSVSLSEIKPGDIVCYEGHVGIYAGNNTLVHASNKKDGIKYTSPITYRNIVAIRRIF